MRLTGKEMREKMKTHIGVCLLALYPLCPAFADDIPTLTVQVPAPEPATQELRIGVLGARIDNNSGIIEQIYPGSDLVSFAVPPGSIIGLINGKVFSRDTFRAECRGLPGTKISLLIFTVSGDKDILVTRRDARLFLKYDQSDRYFAQCAKVKYVVPVPTVNKDAYNEATERYNQTKY